MTWIFFEGEREGLHYKGEIYKKMVIRYYQLQGYSLKMSSSLESGLTDIILWKKGEPDLWIETKSTKISIFGKAKFRKQLIDYFYKWLKEKFNFHIVSEGFTRIKDTKKILGKDAVPSEILKWFYEAEKMDFKFKDKEGIFKGSSPDDIVKFFKSVTIIIANENQLLREVVRREEEQRENPSSIYKTLLSEARNKRNPLFKKTEVIINFLPLYFPDVFWEAKLKNQYKRIKTIYNEANKLGISLIPPFSFTDPNKIPIIIRSFDKKIEVLGAFLEEKPKLRKFNDLSYTGKLKLLNSHLKRYLWAKGLRRYGSKYCFAYASPFDGKKTKIEPILIKRKNGDTKVVTRPIYKDNKELYYFEHRAISVKLDFVNEEFGIFIWPTFLFTSNGIEKIERDGASRIHAKYRNPLYTRNLNKKTELLFWEEILTEKNNFQKEKEQWFSDFGLKKMIRINIDWTSESRDAKQSVLEQFYGDET